MFVNPTPEPPATRSRARSTSAAASGGVNFPFDQFALTHESTGKKALIHVVPWSEFPTAPPTLATHKGGGARGQRHIFQKRCWHGYRGDQGLGFRVQGSGFRVQGSGCRAQGFECRGCRVWARTWPRTFLALGVGSKGLLRLPQSGRPDG